MTTDSTGDAEVVLPNDSIGDAEVANTITIDLATLASTVTVVDGTDATSFVAIFDSATGSLAAKTDGALLYDASNGTLTTTTFVGALTGAATDLNCTDCINATEIEDIYLLNSGDSGSGNYSWTGLHEWTNTLTASSSQQDLNLTLGNDADVDNVYGLNIDVTSAGTGDADVLAAINIANLVSADSAVLERAIQIGNSWDANLFFADTTTQIQVSNTGVIVFEDDAGNDLLSLADAGAIVVGSAGNTAITLTTDSTGNAEVVLPDGSIGSTEILDGDLLEADLKVVDTAADEECLTYESTGGDFEWQSCGGGSTSLQSAYNTATIGLIETDATNPILFTETTAEAHTVDILQITSNTATTGTNSGDLLQLTMDAADANGLTGQGIRMIIDQSQNTGNAILVQDDAAATLFQLDEDGQLTFGTVAGTTAITITDTDYTNALSIGDNDITGTTFDLIGTDAIINFSDFDVIAEGFTTIAPDSAGDAITITNGNGDIQALVVDASGTDFTNTAGLIDLNVDTSTDTAVGGVYLTLTDIADNGADTIYGNRTDLVIDTDVGASGTDTAYGEYILVANNDATSTAYGLYVDAGTGAGTEYAAVFLNGNVGIGDTTPDAKLNIESTITTSGATAVAGVLTELTLTNGTASGTQFGNRSLITVDGGTAGTEVADFIRVTDSTSLANTVRGLEIQTWSGTNTAGTNTGIAAYGKTFGITATIDALAGGVSSPAAIFADLDNGSAATAGNAIRAYTDNATSANLVSFYQETSAYTGTGLIMNFGNNSGSFVGNFLDLQKAGTSKFSVNEKGRLDIKIADADNAVGIYINSEESTTSSMLLQVESDANTADSVKFSVSAEGIVNLNLNATATTNGLCQSGSDIDAASNTQADVVACSAAPGDIAEWYETETGVEVGDVVMTTAGTFTYSEPIFNPLTGMETGEIATNNISILDKATTGAGTIIGVVSTSPYQAFGKSIISSGALNPKPIALSGRVPVKISDENGVVVAGDRLTVSGTLPGFAMKMTDSGQSIGVAIDDADSSSLTVMAFINLGYQDFNGLTFQTNTQLFTTGFSFGGDVEFNLPPIFNKDTAGFARIKGGDRRVEINFENAYVVEPVVNVTLAFEEGDNITDQEAQIIFDADIKFLVVEKSQSGFTILINQNAPRDLRFSWSALAVRDANIFDSIFEGLIFTPPAPSSSPTPSPVPGCTDSSATNYDPSATEDDGSCVAPAPDPTPPPTPDPSPTPPPDPTSTP